MLISIVGQMFLLLFLFAKDKNDGEKELFKRQQWKIFDVVIVLLLTMEAYPLYVVLVAYLFLKVNMDLRPLIYSLSTKELTLYALMISLLLLILLFTFRFKKNINILGFGKDNLKKNIGLGLVVALVAFITVDGFHLVLSAEKFKVNNMEKLTPLTTPLDYFVLFFCVVLLGPFVEEIIYRGFLYSPFRKKYGPLGAIIITSLFFGLAHSALSPFLISIFLTTLYEKTESIISTFVAHSVGNLLVILTVLYLLK